MQIHDYNASWREGCIGLFWSNTPDFFAETELKDFTGFLDKLEAGVDRRSEGALYYFVAQEKQALVACGGFAVSPDGINARMCWGMVHRDYHRKGVGRDFLHFRIRRIRQLFPYSSISLDTTQHSKGFFEKQGFVITGITRDFYAPGMDRYDMELRADNVFL